MDFLTGVLTLLAGLAFLVVPWVVRPAGSALALATVVAAGVIVTMLGLALLRRAPRPRRPGRPRH